MRYFEVEAKCGHVGKMNCIFIQFAVAAKDGKEAAAKARQIPRVKHGHKDAIKYVKEITFEEYRVLRVKNEADPYLKCKCKREQNQIDISDRIVEDEYNINKRYKVRTRNVEYTMKKIAILEKFWNKMTYDFYIELPIEIA